MKTYLLTTLKMLALGLALSANFAVAAHSNLQGAARATNLHTSAKSVGLQGNLAQTNFNHQITPVKVGGLHSPTKQFVNGNLNQQFKGIHKIHPTIKPVINNGTIKNVNLGLGAGSGKFKPINKIPLCKPVKVPAINPCCVPCPKYFHHWCWLPGWGSCYGFCGGISLPCVTRTVVVEIPVTLADDDLPQIVPGTPAAMTVMNLPSLQGQMFLELGSVALPVNITSWTGSRIEFQVPAVGIQGPTPVKLLVMGADGQLLRTVNAELVAATVEQE